MEVDMLSEDVHHRLAYFLKTDDRINSEFWKDWIMVRKDAMRFIGSYLAGYAMNEIEKVIRICDKNQGVFEHHLEQIVRNRDNSFPCLTSSMTRENWDDLENTLNKKKSSILANIEAQLDDGPSSQDTIHKGAKLFIDYVAQQDDLLKKEVSQNIGRNEKLFTKLVDITGEILCTIFYIKLCSYIILGQKPGYTDITAGDAASVCQTRKLELYEALKKKEYGLAKRLGRELALIAEISAAWYASKISGLHEQRRRCLDDKIKEASLEEELQTIKAMKFRICDYAFGMYFATALEDTLKSEARYASKLGYDVIKPHVMIPPDTIKGILTNQRKYLNKEVTVTGLVSNIQDKKWFIRGREAVLSKFDITEDSHTVNVIHFGHMLRDNGLDDGVLITVTGTFQKSEKPDEQVYEIKMGNIGFRKMRNASWYHRYRWLASQWWDNGTDTADCDWTFYPARPSEPVELSLSHVPGIKKEELNERLEEMRQGSPIAKAAINAAKNIRRNIYYKSFMDKIRSTQFKAMAIDEVLSEIDTIEGR
jgi:hypothetical protein